MIPKNCWQMTSVLRFTQYHKLLLFILLMARPAKAFLVITKIFASSRSNKKKKNVFRFNILMYVYEIFVWFSSKYVCFVKFTFLSV